MDYMLVVKSPVASPECVSFPEVMLVVNRPVAEPVVMVVDGAMNVVKSSVPKPQIMSAPAGPIDVVKSPVASPLCRSATGVKSVQVSGVFSSALEVIVYPFRCELFALQRLLV